MKTLTEFFTRHAQSTGRSKSVLPSARSVFLGVRLLIIFVMLASPLLPSRQQLGTLLAVQPGDSALEAVSKTIASPIAQTFAPEEAAAASFVNWVPIVPSTYATSIDSSGRYGLCTFLNCFNNNPTRQTDSTLTNFNNLSILVGLLGGLYTKVDLGQTFPAGTRAGFLVDPGSGLLDLGIGTQIQVRTYTGNTLQETYTLGGLIDLSVFGSGSQRIVGFVTTQSYDQVEIRYGSLGGVFGDLDVYYPVVGYTSDQQVSKSVSASDVVSPSAPLVYTLRITNTGNFTATSVVVTDSLPAGLSGLSASNSFGVGNPALTAGSNAVWSIGTLAPNASGTILITATSPATNTLVINRSRIGSATADFNTLNNGSATVSTVLSGVCTDEGIPPYIFKASDGASVVADTAKTGTFGVCVNGLTCSVVNPNNATSDGTTDFANLSVSLGLAAGARLTIDPGATYPAGVRAGFAVKPNSGLIDLSLLTGVRIKTYLSGTLQEDVATNGSLINLSLFGAGGERLISFKTTKAFDEIQVQTSSLVAALLDLRVHYGFIAFDAPVCGISGGIQVNPYSKNFGSVAVGLNSVTQLITITNVGVAAGSISGISLVGSNLADFVALPTGTCGNIALITALVPVTLAAGASCNVPVRFVPLSVGGKTAALQVVADDGIAMRDDNGEIFAHSSAIKTAKAVVGRVAMATSTTSVPLTGSALLGSAPDLTTTIGQPSPAFVAGSASNVPMTVTNSGTGPTTGAITATMTLPTGMNAPASFSNNGWTCTTTGQTVNCSNVGPIAASSSSTVQVPVTPDNTTVGTTPPFNGSSGTAGESNTGNNAAPTMTPSVAVAAAAPTCLLSNGTVTSNETDTDPLDNTASICVPIGASSPDLTTTIGQPTPAMVAGQSSSLPVTVTNGGAGPTTGPITTTITLPSGVTAPASFSSGGNTCTTSGSTVTCINPGPIANGSSNTLQVPVTPNVSTVGTQPVFNATTATPGETATGNNAATPLTTSPAVVAAPAPDLTTTLGQPAPALVAGSPSNIPVTVTNSGTGPTTGPITTTMTLPAGVTAPATFSNNGWTCATSGSTVTCTNPGPIANGGNSAFTVPVTPDVSTVGTTPAFNATTAPTAGETNTGNNAASPMTPTTAVVAGPTPDLTTAVGQPTTPFVAGAASNVPVTVTNAGTGPTTGPITTTMTLPTGTTAPAGFSSNGWSCATSGQTVTCTNAGPIAAGGSSSFNVPVTPDASTVGTQPVFNATTQPTAGETNTGNNAAAPMTPGTAVAAAPAPDLTTVIGQPSPNFVGGIASNVPMTVSNVGNAPTTGPITTTMTLPAGTSAPASFTNNGWSCTTSGQTVTCTNVGPIAAGSSSTVQVPVTAGVGTIGTTPGPFTGTTLPTAGETNTSNNNPTNMMPNAAVVAAPAAPVAPTINTPTDSSSITNTQPVISGIGTPGALITVTESPTGTVLCTTTVGAGSLWSCTPGTPLPVGSHTISAVAANNVGPSPASAPVTFTVDTVPPVAPAITSPAASSTVNDNTPLFSGTGEPGSTVAVKEGATTVCTAIVDGSGNWSCTPSSALPDGAHSVTATATDPAGNVSPPTAPRSFTVATLADLTTTIGNPQPALQATVPSTLPVTVNNIGVAPSSGPVTTTVSLPPGVTAPASFTSGPWTCTATTPPDAFTASTATCVSSTPIPVGGSSTINVPITPDPARVGSSPTFNVTAAGGGEANASNNAATPLSSGPVLPAIRTLPIKVFLHGPFQSATGIMSDGLRLRNLIPLAEPYAGLGFARAGGSGETTTAGVLAVSGSSAVVDWVLVELRDLGNPATLITTRAALLLRNGFVKDVDGTSDLQFSGLTQSSYFVSVRHRNHLGAMTISPVVLSASTALQDFTTMTTAQMNGTNARRTVGSIFTLWAGNANGDGKTQAAGASNDLSAIVSMVLNPANGNTNLVRNYKVSGYRTTDVNMDGDTVAAGASNDVALVVNNVTANPVNQPGLNRNVTVDQRLP